MTDSPNQVDAVDEFIDWAFHAPKYTKGEYKAKLNALLVIARIEEIEMLKYITTNPNTREILDDRIKELEKQRETTHDTTSN